MLLSSLSQPQTASCVLVQSSLAQSGLPLVKQLLNTQATSKSRTLLACFLYPPPSLVTDSDHVAVLDYADDVSGFTENQRSSQDDLLDRISNFPPGGLDLCIDSLNTVLQNQGSLRHAFQFVYKVLATLQHRSGRNRLILHAVVPCPLIPLLCDTSFSSSLCHVIAHPPEILSELTEVYSVPPPPMSTAAKFWSVFMPFSGRGYESVRLVYGEKGEGPCSDEIVFEVIMRGTGDRTGRRKAIERELNGFKAGSTAEVCDLFELSSLVRYLSNTREHKGAQDPTQNLSFNLALTQAQQESRAEVPLPYAHSDAQRHDPREGGNIYYDPDSADDLDDDDPDEDLDI